MRLCGRRASSVQALFFPLFMLNLIQLLWWDLKKLLHKQMPANIELKQHCKEEWAEIPLQQCKELINSEKMIKLLQLNIPSILEDVLSFSLDWM